MAFKEEVQYTVHVRLVVLQRYRALRDNDVSEEKVEEMLVLVTL